MDSRRALRNFWGTYVPGAPDRNTSPICHALILMGDWCVSDVGRRHRFQGRPRRESGFSSRKAKSGELKKVEREREESCAHLTKPANGRPLYGPPIKSTAEVVPAKNLVSHKTCFRSVSLEIGRLRFPVFQHGVLSCLAIRRCNILPMCDKWEWSAFGRKWTFR